MVNEQIAYLAAERRGWKFSKRTGKCCRGGKSFPALAGVAFSGETGCWGVVFAKRLCGRRQNLVKGSRMDVGTDLGAGCLMAWAIEGSGLSTCSQRFLAHLL